VIEAVSIEAVSAGGEARHTVPARHATVRQHGSAAPGLCRGRCRTSPFTRAGSWCRDRIDGPALVAEPHGTTVVEPGWQLAVNALKSPRTQAPDAPDSHSGHRTAVDPVMLGVFQPICSWRSLTDGLRLRTRPIREHRSGSISHAPVRPGRALIANAAAHARSTGIHGGIGARRVIRDNHGAQGRASAGGRLHA